MEKKIKIKNLKTYIESRSKTKVICTIGPSTCEVNSIVRLIKSGMSVARLNLSHGKEKEHHKYIKNIREASEKTGIIIGILADIPGPKFRVGDIEKNTYLKAGSDFTLTDREIKGNKNIAQVWPKGLPNDAKYFYPKKTKILIDEGKITLEVKNTNGLDVKCKVLTGGYLVSNKSVTTPGNTTRLDYFTKETKEAIEFINKADVNFVGASYVRDVYDVRNIREKIKKSQQIISKIEIYDAVENLEEIIDASDGVMVARGDLGVELPFEEVPSKQKMIIRLANERGKPVITATQMLESMISIPNPTRAEATDVYNAVRDGTDAIMLSAETSIGKYPFLAVEAMQKIAKKAEQFLEYEKLSERRRSYTSKKGTFVNDAIGYSSSITAEAVGAKFIIAYSSSGRSAEMVASYRPSKNILAITESKHVAENLTIVWGVNTVVQKHLSDIQSMFYSASEFIISNKLAKKNDKIVVIAGVPIGVKGTTNLLRVVTLPEPKIH
ncbi:MAG: pyruvate kinase [Chloroflexi bacterium]|nr:pyruvate kinase [Chloroflexota bacterium]